MGSGLYLKLKPGERLQLKGTEYYVRNNGQVTADLHIFTESGLREHEKATFAERASRDQAAGYAKPKRGKFG